MKVGQLLITKLPFKNGGITEKPRCYLIVKVNENYVGILNSSTIKGKEHKLLYDSTYKIVNYNPPYKQPSFIKLDSYLEFKISELPKYKITKDILNSNDLNKILDLFPTFNNNITIK